MSKPASSHFSQAGAFASLMMLLLLPAANASPPLPPAPTLPDHPTIGPVPVPAIGPHPNALFTGVSCGPLNGIVNEVCATVTLDMQIVAASICNSNGNPVGAGQNCYQLEYSMQAHSTLPGLNGHVSGGHGGMAICSSSALLTPACSAGGTPIDIAANPGHCDRATALVSDDVFDSGTADSGTHCL